MAAGRISWSWRGPNPVALWQVPARHPSKSGMAGRDALENARTDDSRQRILYVG
jgi:hypothetical protein